MKKLLSIILICICVLSLCACSNDKNVDEPKEWDCTVICAENQDTGHIITYSNEKIISSTGILTLQNQNDFDIEITFLGDGQDNPTTIKAGGVAIFYEIKEDTEYMVGCHADVSEGTEIKLKVYDGERSEPY